MIRLSAASTAAAVRATVVASTVLAALAVAFVFAFSLPAAAEEPAPPLPPCRAQAPAEVLDCLIAALNAGDMHALGNLLARDFVADHAPKDAPTPDPADREMFLKLMQSFFDSDRVQTHSFSLAFDGEAQEVGPGSWNLEEVRFSLEVFGTDTVSKDGVQSEVPDQQHRVETVDSFEIREVRAPVGLPGEGRHYEIVRWTTGD